TTDYTAKVIFLCASTLNSTWLLMRSATDVWPGGLGSSSGELGHNLLDHHFRLGAEGAIEGMADKYYNGRRPTGFYIPRYRNLFGEKRDYLRGFGYQGSASRDSWSRAVAETLEQAGVKNVHTYDSGYYPGMGIHEMGTARMGRDPKTSVLNAHNQVWDAPNVFVTDGSCMASASCVNPSLTYMALTARAADFAVNELNRRDL